MPPQGQNQRRRRQTRYGAQLQEKQDLKGAFGIRENQLRRYYREALAEAGETGPGLVVLLERRLDNAIFRAGFAQTRSQARQMASHKLFAVNGHVVSVPSYRLSAGDVVSVKESKRDKSHFQAFDKRMQNVRPPSWITIDPKNYSFEVTNNPSYDEAAIGVDIRAVVEYFAR